MTVTVQAGITVAALQRLLARENQRLPIDVPRPDQATLGGVLAANVSGPRRLGFGTLRDYVIGISAVNDEGHEVKAGGRVVKNVAGYDLCKLFVGSLGTLGILTQVTLKLRPLPDRTALIAVPCSVGEAASLLERLHRSRTRPVALELLNPPAARALDSESTDGPADWLVLVGYEDNADAVCWQMQQLIRELGCSRPMNARVGSAAQSLWERLAEFPAVEGGLAFKATLLPSTLAGFCAEAAGLCPGAALQAHAGNGVVVGRADDLTAEGAASLLAALRQRAAASGGSVIVLRCPPAWKATLSVWGPPRGDAVLMRAVKDQLDPRRLFNPGRFVDGL
jgi:glycolate oxidase FAD binding subunit